MPTYTITAPNGKTLDVTGDHVPSEDELKNIFKSAGISTESSQQPVKTGVGGALPSVTPTAVASGTATAIPTIAQGAEEVATNPAVPRVGSAIGQVVGGVQGAMRSPLDAAGGSWAGGKAGWFTGKLVQKLAGPISQGLETLAPYTSPLKYAAALQGDMTQKVLGMSAEEFAKLPKDEQRQKLAAINSPLQGSLTEHASAAIKSLVNSGWSLMDATRSVYNSLAKRFWQ